MPKLSIIMPAYNVRNFIGEAIESIMAQTLDDWELIIVNDGSTDSTPDVAGKFAQVDSRIKFFDLPHRGVSEARNFGMKHTTGGYIHFMDSDDALLSDFYEKMVSVLDDNPTLDFVTSGYLMEYRRKDGAKSAKTELRLPLECENKTKIDKETSLRLITENILLSTVSNKIFKRNFIFSHTNLLFNTTMHRFEDSDYICKALTYSPQWRIIKYAGYVYVHRMQNSLSKSIDEFLIDDLKTYTHNVSLAVNTCGSESEILRSLHNYLGLTNFKYILGLLYKDRSFSKRNRKMMRLALDDNELFSLLKQDKAKGIKNRFLRFLFLKRCVILLDLLGSIRFHAPIQIYKHND